MTNDPEIDVSKYIWQVGENSWIVTPFDVGNDEVAITLPDKVLKALDLDVDDTITWIVRDNGSIEMTKKKDNRDRNNDE